MQYKKKAPYQKRSTASRRSKFSSKSKYGKKTSYSKARVSGYMKDFTRHLFTGYCEIMHKRNGAEDARDAISFSIPCDVNKVWSVADHKDTLQALSAANSGVIMTKGDNTETVLSAATARLTLPNFMYHKSAWHLMRIDFVKIKLTLPTSNLDHCLMISTDRGDSNVVTSTQQALTGAHVSYLPNSNKRQFTYTWRPKDAQDREWISTNASRADALTNYIKVFQKLEPKSDTLAVTLPNAAGTNVSGISDGAESQLLGRRLSTTAIEVTYGISFRDSKTRADSVVHTQGQVLN